MAIHKYKLSPYPGEQRVAMYPPVQFLSVGVQDHQIVFWAAVNNSLEMKPYSFKLLFTGDTARELPGTHIGTVTREGLVYHVFFSKDN